MSMRCAFTLAKQVTIYNQSYSNCTVYHYGYYVLLLRSKNEKPYVITGNAFVKQ